MSCVIGTPSFIQMNVSGGEPVEVQVNVKEEPITTSKADIDDGVLIIAGAAV